MEECGYCRKSDKERLFNTNSVIGEAWMEVSENNLLVRYKGGFGKGFTIGTEINYCPMCGRQL
ncbi:hypothetical protein [Lactobacillus terrae]|uniref:hypothetical protein n=1 Tax=Lactobacillus terrae TaxID=2269374 RepID=UPI000C1B680E|nr:hypothetical protein [Lactobacillus terrae]